MLSDVAALAVVAMPQRLPNALSCYANVLRQTELKDDRHMPVVLLLIKKLAI